MHENNITREKGLGSSFLTLTYADHNLPPDGSLWPDDHKEFVNKLKCKLHRDFGRGFRYYMSGEYGEKFQRPHYHYLIFGHDFPDKTFHRQHRGHKYYVSEELNKLWPYGHSLIGHVTPESAAYTARYVMKKQTGQSALSHYVNADGVVLEPEFSRMSLRPGIGAEWFEKYGEQDVYDSGDFIVMNGRKYSTPRYYDTLLERLDVEKLADIKSRRRAFAEAHASDNTYERLLVKAESLELRLDKLKRGYEDGTT